MGWSSLLPERFSGFEGWVIRIFIVLGLLVIGPWALLVVYDFLLYVFRTITYEIPYIGGRALGTRRPRAPSLKKRGDGRVRGFSFKGTSVSSGGDGGIGEVGVSSGVESVGVEMKRRGIGKDEIAVVEEEEEER